MSTAAQFLAAAASEVGYTEHPAGSNRTKFAIEARVADGYAWCMTFLMAIAKRTGLVLPVTASTRTFWAWAQQGKAGLSVVSWADARPGDFVLYDWPGGNTPTDHVGVLKAKVPGDRPMVTIEGNTSFDDAGSQTNGGAVAERHRSLSNVRGFVRPPFTDDEEDDMFTTEDRHKLDQLVDWIGPAALPAIGRLEQAVAHVAQLVEDHETPEVDVDAVAAKLRSALGDAVAAELSERLKA